MKNKTVWITGASSGIGEALAYELDKEGVNIILSARSVNKLNEIQKKFYSGFFLSYNRSCYFG